ADQVILGDGNITTPVFNTYIDVNKLPSISTLEYTLQPSNILFQVGAYQGESIFTVTKNNFVIINGDLLVKKNSGSLTAIESKIQEINSDPFLVEYKIKEGEKLEKYDVVKLGLDRTVSKYDYKLDGNKEKFVIGVVEEITEENKCLVRIYGMTFVKDKISEFLPQSWIALHKSKNNTNDLCEVFIK